MALVLVTRPDGSQILINPVFVARAKPPLPGDYSGLDNVSIVLEFNDGHRQAIRETLKEFAALANKAGV